MTVGRRWIAIATTIFAAILMIAPAAFADGGSYDSNGPFNDYYQDGGGSVQGCNWYVLGHVDDVPKVDLTVVFVNGQGDQVSVPVTADPSFRAVVGAAPNGRGGCAEYFSWAYVEKGNRVLARGPFLGTRTLNFPHIRTLTLSPSPAQ